MNTFSPAFSHLSIYLYIVNFFVFWLYALRCCITHKLFKLFICTFLLETHISFICRTSLQSEVSEPGLLTSTFMPKLAKSLSKSKSNNLQQCTNLQYTVHYIMFVHLTCCVQLPGILVQNP